MAREAAEEVKEVAVASAAIGGGGGGLDMFADNFDADMFAENPLVPVGTAPAKKALLDNYDDAEGYYNFQVCSTCPSYSHFSISRWRYMEIVVALLAPR